MAIYSNLNSDNSNNNNLNSFTIMNDEAISPYRRTFRGPSICAKIILVNSALGGRGSEIWVSHAEEVKSLNLYLDGSHPGQLGVSRREHVSALLREKFLRRWRNCHTRDTARPVENFRVDLAD